MWYESHERMYIVKMNSTLPSRRGEHTKKKIEIREVNWGEDGATTEKKEEKWRGAIPEGSEKRIKEGNGIRVKKKVFLNI